MAQTRYDYEDELETELEDEMEVEGEDEDEAFFGPLMGLAQSVLGEGEIEGEAEDEMEGAYEDEWEDELGRAFEDETEDEDEAFFGPLMGIAKSLLGGAAGEGEDEWEEELEDEAEEFFKNIGRFLNKHKDKLKWVAKKIGPLVATAVGGPAAGAIARAVTSQLEGELEDELEAELEELATAPVSAQGAFAEYLAGAASEAETEAEAEAFAGAAVTLTLSERDRRRLEELLPHLVRGASVLTRVLYRSPYTRPAVRLVPGIVDSAARTLVRYPSGQLQPADVGAVVGGSASRVLSDPRWRSYGLRRHSRGLAQARTRRGVYLNRPYARSRGYAGPVTTRRGATVRRQPTSVRVAPSGARIRAPRTGFVRVVTPVRVPSRAGRPARTVRVVSDVRVPRGAVPAGRPVGIGGRRAR